MAPAATTAGGASIGTQSKWSRRGGFELSGAVWFAITAVLLGAVVPLLFVATTERVASASNAWLWSVLLTSVVGLRIAWLGSLDPRRLFELIFWIFTYAFMGLAPIVQIRTNVYPNTTPDIDTRLNVMATAIVAVGCLAFAIGGAIAGNRVPRAARNVVTRVSPHRTFFLSMLALLISAYYVSKVGVGALLSTREQRSVIEDQLWPNSTIAAIVRAAATLPLLVAFAALMRLRRERRLVGGYGPAVLPWAVLAVLFLIINPLTAPRYLLGTALLSVAAALGAIATDKRARLLIAALVVGLVVVFPYADFARTNNDRGPLKIGGPAQSLSSADFDAYDQMVNTVDYVRVEGNTNGQQLAGSVLFWVPRAAWPDKPDNTGELLAEFREYKFKNLSAPIWSELWLDGGWPLLVLGMGGLGWGFRRWDERSKAQAREVRPGVLAGILPFYMILVIRGSLLQAMAGLTVLVLSGVYVSRRVLEPEPDDAQP